MDQNIFLVGIAIAVVTLDIVVRIFVFPHRRDDFYKALLEMQAGVAAGRRNRTREAAIDEPLSRALLEYFQQSFTSRQVMTTLAMSTEGLDGKRLEEDVASRVAKDWRRELSINGIRRVIMILVGANLIEVRDGRFVLTSIGWKLFQKTKTNMGPRWSEAAAPSLLHAQ